MKKRITKRIVDAARPSDRDFLIWDTDTKGFGLKVTPTGKRVYVMQRRVGGRVRRYTIGLHGSPWTPDLARDEALRLLGQIAQGKDPAEAKSEARRNISLAELCRVYLSEGCETKKPSSVEKDRSKIVRHIIPLLGSKAIRTLSRADIERFISDVAEGKTARDERTGFRGRAIVRGGKAAANRAVGTLSAVLGFAVNRGLLDHNPAIGVKRYRNGHRERFLSTPELARLGEALAKAEQRGENPFAVAAIRLLMLSGCRRNEVLALRWDWVDFERAALRLPDSKTGAKVVALGAPALELLHSIPRIDGSPYVFPSAKSDGHFVGLQRVWARIRGQAGLTDVRLHDLRHSFASVGAASGDSLYIIGKLLGHKQSVTTQRYAHLRDDPLRAAADRIAAQIDAAMNSDAPSDVVDLPNRTA